MELQLGNVSIVIVEFIDLWLLEIFLFAFDSNCFYYFATVWNLIQTQVA